MPKIIIERLDRRLLALGKTSYDASEDAGLEKKFLHDLISGRKQSVQMGSLHRIARALRTTPEYLIGASDIEEDGTGYPVRQRDDGGGLMIVGTVEDGTFRRPEEPRQAALQVAPDSRFSGAREGIYVYDGRPSVEHGLLSGDYLCAINPDDFATISGPIPAGSLIIVSTPGQSGTRELSMKILRYSGPVKLGFRCCGQEEVVEIPNKDDTARIVGVVRRVIRSV